jgi:hypothetical protein
VRQPIATWNRARGAWETAQTSVLCGHPVLFSETWPTSGMTQGGSLYPLPTLVLRTAASECSSSDGLPPTPAAGNFNDGESLESWEARRQANLAKGINGSGQGTPLAVAVQLLPTPRAQEFEVADTDAMLERRETAAARHHNNGFGLTLAQATVLLRTPTAQLAVNGGSQHPDRRKAGGHGPTLADEVEHLLPTPQAHDAASPKTPEQIKASRARQPKRVGGGGPGFGNLNEKVMDLLPTPDATHGRKTSRTSLLLPGVAETLLPTPNASDGKGSSGSQRRPRDGQARPLSDVDLPEAIALLPTPQAADNRRGADVEMGGTRPSGAKRSNGLVTAAALLPTPRTTDRPSMKPSPSSTTGKHGRDLAPTIGSLLPTPAAGDSKASGSRNLPGSNAHPGVSLTDAVVTGNSSTPRRSSGDRTSPRSAAGKRSSDGQLPGQLSLDELASG